MKSKPRPAPARPSPTGAPLDSFESLDNIGPKWAERLQEIGIARFEDLAQYTPPLLAAALNKQAGKEIIKEAKIEREDWIGQARRKLGEARQPTVPATSGITEIVEDNGASEGYHTAHEFTVFLDRRDPAGDGPPWYTRVYHDKSGDEETFPTLEPSAWVPWMFSRAHLDEVKAPVTQARLEIADLQVDEAPIADRRGLAVRLAYSLHLPEGKLGLPRLRVGIFMQNEETGAIDCVVDEVVDEALADSGAIQVAFPTPPLGAYWLHAMLTLLPPYPACATSTCYGKRIRVML